MNGKKKNYYPVIKYAIELPNKSNPRRKQRGILEES